MAHHNNNRRSRSKSRVRIQGSRTWGVFASLLALSPVLIGIPTLSIWTHYNLPKPIISQYDPQTHLPQLSEHAILQTAKHLSENIGFRTVGTREHMLGDEWMWEQALGIMELCDEVKKKEPTRRLECEIWHQIGNGSHRFDIMNTRMYKTYVNLTNIIIRLSTTSTPLPPSPSHLTSSNSSFSHLPSESVEEIQEDLEIHPSKLHSLLINAHVDSTLPGPGAADDALAVGVMLEIIRNLLETEGWEPEFGVIFLFNNAEESLQDGSHLFSTQHPIAPTVRAMINLEASGTSGPELLFQATSQEMIQAYSHVPRPYGTIVANDVFATGLIISDTDFRQFEEYLNVTGLDMAIVGNSYFYHTRKDLVKFIEPGAAQHMVENAHALILYLSSNVSPLGNLHHGHERPPTFFFSTLGKVFIQYTFRTATTLHIGLFISTVGWIWLGFGVSGSGSGSGRAGVLGRKKVKQFSKDGKSEKKKLNGAVTSSSSSTRNQQDHADVAIVTATEVWIELFKGIGLIISAFFGAIISANLWALVMSKVLKKGLSWFRVEYSCLLLYGPPALVGALLPQLLFSTHARERTMLYALLLTHSFIAVFFQLLSIGSAGLTFFSGLPMLLALVVESIFFDSKNTNTAGERPTLAVYAIGQTTSLLFGAELFCAITDVFVPLTGRMGVDPPAENIIASIVAFLVSYVLPYTIPFFHRFGKRFIWKSFLFGVGATIVATTVFYLREPFDAMHPRRVVAIHVENITTNEVSLHMAALDSAPGFEALTQDIAKIVSGPDAKSEYVGMNPYNGNLDVLYPLSGFLKTYKVELASYESKWAATSSTDGKFVVKAENDVINESEGTRSLTIHIRHPGLIWTVIAFDAHVTSWSLDKNPPKERARHYIKESSFYGVDEWTVEITYLLPSPSSSSAKSEKDGLMINFIGIKEKAMWPGKKSEDGVVGDNFEVRGRDPAMVIFEKLDAWLEESTDDAAEGVLLGCVAGVVVI